jgi:hypothetical protein
MTSVAEEGWNNVACVRSIVNHEVRYEYGQSSLGLAAADKGNDILHLQHLRRRVSMPSD